MNGSRRRISRRRATRGTDTRSGERGAVVVEAAILLPVITLLLFGLVEFGLLFKDELTVSSAAGATAREGAAIPKQPDYQDDMIEELNRRLTGTGLGSGDQFVIYKADPGQDNGLPDGATSEGEIWDACEAATADCTRYEYNGTDWVQNGAADWTAAEQSACRDGELDQLGVWVNITHDYITRFIGVGSRQVTSRSLYALEPRLPGECEAT
ncbi:MAG: pilus assembly protein [Acidimicrobiia bacterium]